MSDKKTHWKKLVNPDYLGAYSLDNGDGTFAELTVKIVKVKREEVFNPSSGKKDMVVIAELQNQKPVILNATNKKRLEAHFGRYIEDWAGKTIVLCAEKCRAKGGGTTDGIRVKESLPVAKELPALTPKSDKWADAVFSLKSKAATIEKIKLYYSLSVSDEKHLQDEANKSE